MLIDYCRRPYVIAPSLTSCCCCCCCYWCCGCGPPYIDITRCRSPILAPNGISAPSALCNRFRRRHVRNLSYALSLSHTQAHIHTILYRLTVYWHIKTAEQRIVIQQYGDSYTGRWWVGCYVWYSEGGTGRARPGSSRCTECKAQMRWRLVFMQYSVLRLDIERFAITKLTLNVIQRHWS